MIIILSILCVALLGKLDVWSLFALLWLGNLSRGQDISVITFTMSCFSFRFWWGGMEGGFLDSDVALKVVPLFESIAALSKVLLASERA